MNLLDQGLNNNNNTGFQKYRPSKLKSIGLVTLWACLALSAPVTTQPAHAINKVQSRQAEEAYEKALISFQGGKEKEASIHLKNALQF